MTSERILIIDDSPIDARFASKILTEAGYFTTIIHESEEAVTVARQLKPDLILLDVTMPKIDGYEVCQQLKNDPQVCHVNTVLYTIRDQFIDCLKGIEAGADDFIIKTLSAKDFLNRVRSILSEQKQGQIGPLESLDLALIQPLAELQDRQELFYLLYRSFNKHVRETMSVVLGSHVTSILLDRAVEKSAARFPIFGELDLNHVTGFLFDTSVIQEVSAQELIQWFQTFCHELYVLVMKLTRTRANGAREARGVTKGMTEMIRDLHSQYEKLQEQSPQSATSGEPEVTSDEPITGQASVTAPTSTTRALTPDCTLDSTGNLVHCNDDLAQILRSTKQELLGETFSRYLTDQTRQVLTRVLDRLVDKGMAEAKLSLVAKDGAIVHTDARFNALYDSQGYFAMTRCGLQVIPESILIEERDKEIEKLKQSLQQWQDEFSGLASTISHDLRQPLHAILLLCQFLQDEFQGKLEDQAVEYVRSIEQAGSRLKKMVEDVVHYARVMRDVDSLEAVNLNQLIEEVGGELSAELEKRGASLRVQGELPTVTCNREQIAELIRQLIRNGIKFNEQAQPTVEIGLAKEDAEGYTFSVKDNGIGIEDAYHESIFRLFYRLHSPEEYEGTGAGLSICRRIMDAHGGRIWVRSELGAGATFFFSLPGASRSN